MACAALIGTCNALYAQDWNQLGNTVSLPSHFLGCDAASTQPLRFSTLGNYRQEWRTFNTLRMSLNGSSSNTIGSFAGMNTTGYLGLAPNDALLTTAPYTPMSRLHLHQGVGTVQTFGYRPWMQNGITFTGNNDQAYIGHLYRGASLSDQTDLVFQWSNDDGEGEYGPDRMRWIFTNAYTGASNGASSYEGLEAMRLYVPDAGQAYLGVGDIYAAGVEPSERLDVLTRTMRIRRLVPDYHNDDLAKVVVTDDGGRLHWRDASTLGGNAACDWIVQPNHDVSTAYAGLTNPCPYEKHNVGVGVMDPSAKVDVYKEFSEGIGLDVGVRSVVHIEGGVKHAFSGTSAVAGAENVGAIVGADNAGRNWGVVSYTGSGGTGTGVVGGFFQADREFHSGDAMAVWGRVTNMSAVGTGWAAYFEGMGFLSNGPWVYSDEELKSDIQDIPGETSLERIMALSPKSYVFNIDEHPGMGMPDGVQYGLLSQEVESIYPALVKQVERPEVIGQDGEVEEEAVSFKAMKYEGLIADLIGAVKHQQATINAMQEQLNACCSSGGDQRALPGGDNGSPAQETDLRIIPNPVAARTELRYTVGTEGRVRLTITAPDGRTIRTQEEGLRAVGTYSYGWDTTALAPGTYHCTLFVNDELVVRKAVKVE